jgi:2,3-dihydroxybenzoate decarboxylase
VDSTNTETKVDAERNLERAPPVPLSSTSLTETFASDTITMTTSVTSATQKGGDSTVIVKPAQGYKRIATEEAFATSEMLKHYAKLLAKGGIDDPGFHSLWGFYLNSKAPRAIAVIERLQDLGSRRIGDMDATGIDRQIISLTAPGVQILDKATAVSLARSANDELAEAVRSHPTRFTGLTAVAPQDPKSAAKEIERGVTKLGFKGVIVNSHTHGEYLDDPKFWDIFEAAEAHNVPVYLHPTSMSRAMVTPFLARGLDGAIYGFGAETGLHMLRIIVSGVFDRFPNLKMMIGHLGEALPFWLFRIDYMHRATVAAKRYESMKPLRRKPSDYLRENVYVTTSGMADEAAITYCQKVLGMDRVLYAMDYPYQFVAEEVVTSDNLPLSAADKKKFFQTNAEQAFSL